MARKAVLTNLAGGGILALVLTMAPLGAAGAARTSPGSVAAVTDRSRNGSANDFLRLVWVRPGTVVNTLTLGKRAFFTATSFVEPRVKVEDLVNYVGNYYREGRDLAILRCRPSAEQTRVVAPILATWPNVLPAIAADLGGPGRVCTSPPLTAGEAQICQVALQYTDATQSVYVQGLMQAAEIASQLFATPETQDALSADFGIYPAFTGLGFTVQGSSIEGAATPMQTGEVLANSVVPEYLLVNARLGDAGCRCVQVPDYRKRISAPVDPAYIWKKGRLDGGACRKVARLGRS